MQSSLHLNDYFMFYTQIPTFDWNNITVKVVQVYVYLYNRNESLFLQDRGGGRVPVIVKVKKIKKCIIIKK